MTTPTTARFIVNITTSGRVVHETTCHTVRHLVEGHSHPVGGNDTDTVYERYRATYSTAADLARYRYKRCSVCSPDLPEAKGNPGTREIRPAYIRPWHIGKHFIPIGELTAVTIDEDGYQLHGTRGTLLRTPDQHAEYRIDQTA